MIVLAPSNFSAAMASYFGAFGYSSCPQPHADRLSGLLGGSKPVFPVRPSSMPKVINCILFVYRSLQLHQLGTQLGKDVAESGGVAARVRQAFDQPHGHGIADALMNTMGIVEV